MGNLGVALEANVNDGVAPRVKGSAYIPPQPTSQSRVPKISHANLGVKSSDHTPDFRSIL
jgi:hypothetical protein